MKTTYDFLREKIQTIRPTFSYNGENFDAWKVAAREKLSRLVGMDKFEKVDPRTEIEYTRKIKGATEIRFNFESEEGYRVPCHLLLPDDKPNPPVMICLQGHTTGMHVSLSRDKNGEEVEGPTRVGNNFAIRAVEEGFAAIALEQRNFGELNDEIGCKDPSMINLLFGRTTIGERVWDVQRLIDILETEFSDKVDVDCICLMGNSGGGTATAYTAALEDRIVLAIPSCAMASFKDSIAAVPHCPCNYVPNISNIFDMGDIMAMAYPKYYIQVSGKDDKIFPLFAAQKVFADGERAYIDNNAQDRCTLIEGDGGHRFFPNEVWPVVHKYLGR